MADIQLGTAYSFVPTAFIDIHTPGRQSKQKEISWKVMGRVIYVNRTHGFFMVAFEVNGCALNESFKF